MNENSSDHRLSAQALPWYALIIIGHALSGFMPWLLVIRQLYHQKKRAFAIVLLAVNLIVLAAFGLTALRAGIPWHNLLSWLIAANLVWSLSAWIFQRYLIGPASRRYKLKEWRSWISPISIAVILATGLAVLLAIFPVIGERMQSMYADDILDKHVVLMDFFVYVPILIPYGLLVGFWWAGKGRHFAVTDVITFLCGLGLFYIFLVVAYQLFFFLLFKGKPYQGMEFWALTPNMTSGIKAFFQKMNKYDQLAFVVVPLMLGSVVRIRDFISRSLVIFTIVSFITLPMSFTTREFWSLAQGHIVHNLTAADLKTQQRAFDWMEILLYRYPENDKWPKLALKTARYRYQNNEMESAKKLYQKVATDYQKSARWQFEADLAESVLHSEGFGRKNRGAHTDLPLINHESYLTPNWMALLQIARFWDGGKTSESEFLIKLKALSKSDDKIELSHIPTIADLDEAAENLGFKVLIMPTDEDAAIHLVNSNIPVILPIYNTFYLLNGIDDARSLFTCFKYSQLSERLRKDNDEDIKEIFFSEQEQEQQGDNDKQERQIAAQAYFELPFSFLKNPLQVDSAPFMVVVYPETVGGKIASALSVDLQKLNRQSKGYLAAFIALNALNAGDPVNSIKWAMKSEKLVQEPFGLHIAYLAHELWKTRDKLVQNRLGLENRFPELQTIDEFFTEETIRNFLAEAEKQFLTDQDKGRLRWNIRYEYQDFLDRSNKEELARLIKITLQDVTVNPRYRKAWLNLAELYEWSNDPDGIISALEGALAADTWNEGIALQLAYRYVQADRRIQADTIMKKIDPSNAALNPDYFFCLGALASWEGNREEADKNFASAIEMRRYDPLYHLFYGKLLLEEGRKEEARKALQWAIQIDVEQGEVRRAAQSLLEKTS